jgi:hypothetical protein
MNYQDYINLGFERTDINDSVYFKQTGYKEYFLSKKINDIMCIEMYGCALDKPKLYVKKKNSDDCYIFTLTPESVNDFFKKKELKEFTHAS